MNRRFFRRVTCETHDRNAIANFSEVYSGAVELDDSLPRFAVNCIGLKPFSVAQVANEYFFVGNQANEPSQIAGNRKASFVI